MLTATVNNEPDVVSRYFDRRSWADEARSHAEVVEVFRPHIGWQRYPGRKKINEELLLLLAADGVTAVTLRVRYAASRVVSADFTMTELT